MDLVANTVMRFAHGPEMHAWFRGTGKNPIVIFVALPAFLEQIEHFLAHGQSTSGILGLSAHDEDRAIDEINVRVGHAEDFIWPHSLPEHDDGDALEGLGGKCQILELLFKRQDVDIRDFLWKGFDDGAGTRADTERRPSGFAHSDSCKDWIRWGLPKISLG